MSSSSDTSGDEYDDNVDPDQIEKLLAEKIKKKRLEQQKSKKGSSGKVVTGAKTDYSNTKSCGKEKKGDDIDDIFGGNDKKKRQASDIDDIFAAKSVKNTNEKSAAKKQKVDPNRIVASELTGFNKIKNKPEEKGADSDNVFADTRGLKGTGKRKYVDGLPVYSVDELGIGKGGGTPDCPFDCWCCF